MGVPIIRFTLFALLSIIMFFFYIQKQFVILNCRLKTYYMDLGLIRIILQEKLKKRMRNTYDKIKYSVFKQKKNPELYN